MIASANLHELDEKIAAIKQLLLELDDKADHFPALHRNAKRALASIKMLELNISDIVELMDA